MALMRHLNRNLPDMPDCIGLTKNGRCSRLTILQCQGDICPFKSTKQDADASVRHVRERLAQLDEETQEKIAHKYYRGKRSWQEKR